MKKSVRLAKIAGLVSAASMVALPAIMSAHAQAAPSAAKSNATLTVTYEFTSSGIDRPKSNEKNVTWTVKNKFETTQTLVAQKPSGFAAYHKADAAAQKMEADRMTAANAAAKDMQPQMDQAAKIMAQCGEDEQCMMREAMKMAGQMDPAKAASAKANIGKASVIPADRYQTFSIGTASGTFTVDEVAHEAYFDAACSFKNEATCAIDTTVKGTGKLGDGTGKALPATVMGELDMQEGSVILTFPFAGIGKATKTTASKAGNRKSGTEEVIRSLNVPNTQDIRLTAKCGACKTAEGVYTTQIDDQLLGRKGTLKMTWKLVRP